MVNLGKRIAPPEQALTEAEYSLLQDFIAFSTHPRSSPELTELHLLASLAMAHQGIMKPS